MELYCAGGVKNWQRPNSLGFPNSFFRITQPKGLSRCFVYIALQNLALEDTKDVFHRSTVLTKSWLRPGENSTESVEKLRKTLGKPHLIIKKYVFRPSDRLYIFL